MNKTVAYMTVVNCRAKNKNEIMTTGKNYVFRLDCRLMARIQLMESSRVGQETYRIARESQAIRNTFSLPYTLAGGKSEVWVNRRTVNNSLEPGVDVPSKVFDSLESLRNTIISLQSRAIWEAMKLELVSSH